MRPVFEGRGSQCVPANALREALTRDCKSGTNRLVVLSCWAKRNKPLRLATRERHGPDAHKCGEINSVASREKTPKSGPLAPPTADAGNSATSELTGELELQLRKLVAHEVLNSVRIAQNALDRLSGFVKTSFAQAKEASRPLIWISDIAVSLNDIEAGLTSWAMGNLPYGNELGLLVAARARAMSEKKHRTSVTQGLNHSLRPLRNDLTKKGVRLVADRSDRNLRINMDRQNLRLVLANIAHNAVKYCIPGSNISWRVEVKRFGVRFSIRNLAPGLDEGEVLRVFDIHFRGRNARKSEGTGLGLYVARRICEFHEIAVSYETTPYEQTEGVSWHEIRLDFPNKIIVSG